MNNITKKIGIMGGTFNPPHLGHLISAEFVKDKLKLDKIVFVPTGNISYKSGEELVPKADRFEMTRIAVSNNPDFEISDIEILTEGYSYTFETLEKLKKKYTDAELYFIVGADSLDYMDKWREPQLIFKRCIVAAVSRVGFSSEKSILKAEELEKSFGGKIVFLDMPEVKISSTEIRKMIKENRSVRQLVPCGVIEYINKKNLYKNGDSNR